MKLTYMKTTKLLMMLLLSPGLVANVSSDAKTTIFSTRSLVHDTEVTTSRPTKISKESKSIESKSTFKIFNDDLYSITNFGYFSNFNDLNTFKRILSFIGGAGFFMGIIILAESMLNWLKNTPDSKIAEILQKIFVSVTVLVIASLLSGTVVAGYVMLFEFIESY